MGIRQIEKVRVKEEDNTLSVGGCPVLTATIHANHMVIDWTSKEWKEWKDLVDSCEFKKLSEKAEETLKKAEENKGKGDGKGKKGH